MRRSVRAKTKILEDRFIVTITGRSLEGIGFAVQDNRGVPAFGWRLLTIDRRIQALEPGRLKKAGVRALLGTRFGLLLYIGIRSALSSPEPRRRAVATFGRVGVVMQPEPDRRATWEEANEQRSSGTE